MVLFLNGLFDYMTWYLFDNKHITYISYLFYSSKLHQIHSHNDQIEVANMKKK